MSICMYLHDIHNLLLKDKFDIVYTNRQGHMCIYNFVLLRMAKIFLVLLIYIITGPIF